MEEIYVGIDWGEGKHAYLIQRSDGDVERQGELAAKPAVIHDWMQGLLAEFRERRIVVALEQSRGALIYALQQYSEIVIVPINPRAASAYRNALYLSGAKDDPIDAGLLCNFVRAHRTQLKVWRPDDDVTRKLRLLVEGRRTLVDHRTATTQALTATVKQFFPQIIEWFGSADTKIAREFLRRWSTVAAVQAVRRDTLTKLVRSCTRMKAERLDALLASIRSAVALTNDHSLIEPLSLLAQGYVQLLDALDVGIQSHDEQIAGVWATHPDHDLFSSFPGAGPIMAPRLAVAFGTYRDRFSDAAELQKYSGIAPVIERSGKQSWTHARFRCPKFLKQTFHEFAAASLPFSAWALAFYRQQRDRGAGHHQAVRALAFRWIRVLYHCWKNRRPYDEQVHIAALRTRNSPVVGRLAA